MAQRPLGMILTAGFGTRLLPLSSLRPKPLMELFGKPIIHFLIRMLERAGIGDIILNLHHRPEQIRRFVEESNYKARIHLIHEKEILGTAGGVRNAIRWFNIKNRQLVVVHGDIMCDIDIAPHLQQDHFCTLICAKDREVRGYQGSVGVDENEKIFELGRFYKGERESLHRGFFTGIQILSPRAVSMLENCQSNSLVADVYPQWLRHGQTIIGKLMPLIYDDLGSFSRIFEANMSILNGLHFDFIDPREGLSEFSPGIYLRKDVEIENTATLVGPLMVDAGAKIGRHVYLGPSVIIGKNSVVNDRAHIKNSVILSRSVVEKDERIDCMIALRSARVLVKR